MLKLNLSGSILLIAASTSLMLAGCQKKANTTPAATADATPPAAATPAPAPAADATTPPATPADPAMGAKRNSDLTNK